MLRCSLRISKRSHVLRSLSSKQDIFTAEDISRTSLNDIRNIGISAHIDSGKTTVTERILYYSGRIDAIHDVKGKDGVGAKMDSMELERQRGITIKSAATCMKWQGKTINLIDTPGHIDFTVEVERSLRVLDGAILVLCGSGGVQTQTYTVYRQMRRYGVPFITFINKLDRLGANAYRVLDEMRNKLMLNAAFLQLPIGIEKDFNAVVDILGERVVSFEGDSGEILKYHDVPTAFEGDLITRRTELIECLSNVDDEIGERFLMEEDISNGDIETAMERSVKAQLFTPVLMGSALKNKGIQPLLDCVNKYLPNPGEVKNYAVKLDDESQVLLDSTRTADNPLVALAFKLEQNKFGQLTYMRVYQGHLKRGFPLLNTRTDEKLRVPRLVLMNSNDTQDIQEAYAGDIVAMIGVDCASGDTFIAGDITNAEKVSLESIYVPDPVISLMIKNVKSKDNDSFAKALNRFQKEDPTFKCEYNPEHREMVISGMGELHLDVYAERIRREYGCTIELGEPTVNYRETLDDNASVDFAVTYKRQSGGRGQFAHIEGKITPLENRSSELEFVNSVSAGAIPPNFIKSVEKGVRSAMKEGALTGNPISGIRFQLITGKTHSVDSSDWAFSWSGYFAIKEHFVKQAITLEPWMSLEVTSPEEFSGGVLNSVTERRGITSSLDVIDGFCTVYAKAPLRDMFGYSTKLRTVTQGKGEFTMEFQDYRPVELGDQEELVAKYRQSGAYQNQQRSEFGV